MSMVIHKRKVEPGEKASINIPAGRLPTGRQVLVRLQVIRSREPGPVGLLLGGMHGDEVNGVEIIRRVLAAPWMDDLRCGTLIALPVLNIYGFIHYKREVPDGKDINRSFPGNSRGSMASRLAALLSKKILPLIDWCVDFHTGAGQTYNYPQIRYTRGDARSLDLAEAFAPPFLVAKPPIARSFRKFAFDRGKPVLIYEGGENLRYDGLSVEKGVEGLRRLLVKQGMLEQELLPARSRHLLRTTWLRAPRSGLYQFVKSAGQQVVKGEPLAVIRSPFEREEVRVTARRAGFLIGHNNATLVSQGDALFHIAYD